MTSPANAAAARHRIVRVLELLDSARRREPVSAADAEDAFEAIAFAAAVSAALAGELAEVVGHPAASRRARRLSSLLAVAEEQANAVVDDLRGSLN